MKRKAVSCLLVLAALITMTPTIPTMAAENSDNETQSTQTTTETGTQNSVVKYDQASAFTVTIPKSIALSNSKSAEYTVRVQGDVIGNEIITVTPDTSVILSDSNGKDPVIGDISQEKTEFSSTEVNARSGVGTATGSILANNLTSGDWSGNFKFVIGTNQIGNGIAITSENLATYGIKTTGDVVIPGYVTDDDNTRHAVTSISDYAFRDCNEMTSVAIADSVTEIGTGAFVSCSKLSKAAVPNSVRSIGNSAFDGCTSLSSISYNGNEYDLSNIEPAFVENGVSVGSHVFEHSYSEPVYTWSEDNSTCTATKTCSECHDIVTETADISTKTTDSTCTDEGLNTYTATFKNSGFKTQTKTSKISAKGHKSVSANNAVAATCTTDGKESDTVCSVCGVTLATGKTIAKTGHKYGTPTYTWSKDGKTCVAKRVCANNGTHIETESATITNKVKTPATCTVKGTRTYTATFKNTAFKTQMKDIQDIAALGHSYSSEYTIDTAATCTTDGSKSQHCTRSGCTAKQNVTAITKTGHKYGTPTYTWSKDGKTCVAKRVCANNGTHIETESATITNKVKTPATCTVKGTRTYTATFKNTAFKTQMKDIQDIAALGHSYSSEYTIDTAATCTTDGSKSQHCTRSGCTAKQNVTAITKTGHKYGTPTYTWSKDGKTCVAKRVCANNGTHIETENGTITNKVKTPATYTTKGTTTYTATFKNTAFKAQTKDIQNIPVLEKLTGSVVLSATSGTISYPAAGSFTVTSNKSNGTLSVKSSDPNVATATLDGNTVTVTPGTTAGSAIITVTSAATTSYKAASATYNVTVKSGTLPITAKAYSGTYDGNTHSASVTSSVSGVTFKYGTVKGTYNLTSMPTYTNAGTYVVYYQATKAGYTTFEGSVKTVIQKKATTTSLRSADGILYVTTTGNGTITAQSSDSNIIESVTVNGNRITCIPKKYGNAGTAKITVAVSETTNYKASSDTYNVTVSNRLIANSSLSFWHPDNQYEFGYLNGSGQYVVDGGSMWHCVSLIPITTSGYYYIVGRTGGAPRSCLYNDASRNSLYQSFESSDGYYTYIPAGKYLGSLLFRDEGFNALDLRFVTFSK